jgi:D-tyrosyl-tRNA(Tyr) deacylase
MRALIQRVSQAGVEVGGETVGQINTGLLVLLGVRQGDTDREARFVAEKCLNLRIFDDEQGLMNLSALDIGADILVISQFTLYADTRKGRRPSFVEAAPPEISRPLYETFVGYIKQSGLRTETGRFGAIMDVRLTNAGPVTVMIEKENVP